MTFNDACKILFSALKEKGISNHTQVNEAKKEGKIKMGYKTCRHIIRAAKKDIPLGITHITFLKAAEELGIPMTSKRIYLIKEKDKQTFTEISEDDLRDKIEKLIIWKPIIDMPYKMKTINEFTKGYRQSRDTTIINIVQSVGLDLKIRHEFSLKNKEKEQ